MTKNNLVTKILNGAEKFAGKTFLYGSLIAAPLIYSNVNAQVSTASALNEKGSAAGTKVLQKDMLNAYDIPGYVIIENIAEKQKNKKEVQKPAIESLRVYPTFSTMRGNNKLIPRLVYAPVKAQAEGQEVDVLKYRTNEKDKKNIEDLFMKKGEGGGVIVLNETEAQAAGFHTITTDNGTFVYFPLDEKENTLDDEGKQKVEKGKRIGAIFPADKMVIYEDIRPDRTVEYLVGNPNQVYWLDLNDNETGGDQALHEEGAKLLDSLGRGYLSSKVAESIYLDGNLIDGKAYDFKNFAFLNEAKEEPEKEKTSSEINGRIKASAGFTIPKGYALELNPQLQLGEKIFLGPYVSLSNSTKSLENITQEEPQEILISKFAGLTWYDTGKKLTENTKVSNNLGAGLNLSYIASPSLEAFFKAGFVGQKTTETMKSEGEQGMKINGVKDTSSIYSYNESNSSTEKRMSGYAGAGAEYFPFAKQNNALKNISVYGEAGYVFGKDLGKGTIGSVGVKYKLGKSNKQNTQTK